MDKELSIKEKQKIVLKLKNKTGFSIQKCTELLNANSWNIENIFSKDKSINKKKTKKIFKLEEKNKKAKERIKQYNKKEIEHHYDNFDIDFDKRYLDFDWYLKRCKEQEKKDAKIPLVPIKMGFYTMKEIIKYVNSLLNKNNIPSN